MPCLLQSPPGYPCTHGHPLTAAANHRKTLEEVVKAQEKLCVDSWAILAAGNPSVDAILKSQLSSGMSTAQMLESMEDVW